MPDSICTHCGFTLAEYRSRGLVGCPHCYLSLGEALQADIAWLHQAVADADGGSGNAAGGAEAEESDPESLARWREQITEAVRAENYEEAARLNRLIRGFGGARGPGPGRG
jgi:protein arginine kinase activator